MGLEFSRLNPSPTGKPKQSGQCATISTLLYLPILIYLFLFSALTISAAPVPYNIIPGGLLNRPRPAYSAGIDSPTGVTPSSSNNGSPETSYGYGFGGVGGLLERLGLSRARLNEEGEEGEGEDEEGRREREIQDYMIKMGAAGLGVWGGLKSAGVTLERGEGDRELGGAWSRGSVPGRVRGVGKSGGVLMDMEPMLKEEKVVEKENEEKKVLPVHWEERKPERLKIEFTKGQDAYEHISATNTPELRLLPAGSIAQEKVVFIQEEKQSKEEEKPVGLNLEFPKGQNAKGHTSGRNSPDTQPLSVGPIANQAQEVPDLTVPTIPEFLLPWRHGHPHRQPALANYDARIAEPSILHDTGAATKYRIPYSSGTNPTRNTNPSPPETSASLEDGWKPVINHDLLWTYPPSPLEAGLEAGMEANWPKGKLEPVSTLDKENRLPGLELWKSMRQKDERKEREAGSKTSIVLGGVGRDEEEKKLETPSVMAIELNQDIGADANADGREPFINQDNLWTYPPSPLSAGADLDNWPKSRLEPVSALDKENPLPGLKLWKSMRQKDGRRERKTGSKTPILLRSGGKDSERKGPETPPVKAIDSNHDTRGEYQPVIESSTSTLTAPGRESNPLGGAPRLTISYPGTNPDPAPNARQSFTWRPSQNQNPPTYHPPAPVTFSPGRPGAKQPNTPGTPFSPDLGDRTPIPWPEIVPGPDLTPPIVNLAEQRTYPNSPKMAEDDDRFPQSTLDPLSVVDKDDPLPTLRKWWEAIETKKEWAEYKKQTGREGGESSNKTPQPPQPQPDPASNQQQNRDNSNVNSNGEGGGPSPPDSEVNTDNTTPVDSADNNDSTSPRFRMSTPGTPAPSESGGGSEPSSPMYPQPGSPGWQVFGGLTSGLKKNKKKEIIMMQNLGMPAKDKAGFARWNLENTEHGNRFRTAAMEWVGEVAGSLFGGGRGRGRGGRS